MKKQQAFAIKGMARDISPSKSGSEYAYDIQNMRITAQEGETLLSLVNEKGNKEYTLGILDGITGLKVDIAGKIIGYCIVNKSLVLFAHEEGNDSIYRLGLSGDNTLTGVLLYQGDLGFDDSMVLETLGIYESNSIQKVYWLDGKHQPRFVNIAADIPTMELWKSQETPFDFIAVYAENDNVGITRSSYSGAFPAGTVQYAMTYYNLNGQQTNIFYRSPIYYTSNSDRGAAADETVSNSFTIKIEGADPNFDYIRVYRILRTTANDTPQCRILQDIPIERIEHYSDSGTTYTADDITLVDTGMFGDTVDPNEILYAGGRDVIPECMAQKDNTLFFGNFKTKRSLFDENIANWFREENDNGQLNADACWEFYYGNSIAKGTTGSLYMYENQLGKNSFDITTFKGGETYRFGLVFQDDKGEWSNVVYLDDIHNDMYPKDNESSFNPVKGRLTIPQDIVEQIHEEGYKKVKGVVVYPTYADREVVCQGVLSPTVYNFKDRVDNAPYAASSWFFRDIHGYDSTNARHRDHCVQNSHNWNISTMLKDTANACITDSEIYGASRKDINVVTKGSGYENADVFVDWNVVTLNTPELDFADTVIPSEGLKMRIVGVLPLTSCSNDIYINTSSAPRNTLIENFNKNIFLYNNLSGNGNLMRLSDMDWWDEPYNDKARYTNNTSLWQYPVFPWQRSTSMIAQDTISDTEGWISELNTKIISNIRTSALTLFFSLGKDHVNDYGYDISTVGVYNGSHPLSRLSKDSNDKDFTKQFNYYGEVNTTLIPSGDGYELLYYSERKGNGDDNTDHQVLDVNARSKAGIRITYKSAPHAAFQLRYASDGRQTILPSITIGSKEIGKQSQPDGSPQWSDKFNNNNPDATVSPDSIDSDFTGARRIAAAIIATSDGTTIDDDYIKEHYDVINIDNIKTGGTFSQYGDYIGTFPRNCWVSAEILQSYLSAPKKGDIIVFPNVTTWSNEYYKDTPWQNMPMLYEIREVNYNLPYMESSDDTGYYLFPLGFAKSSNPSEGKYYYVDSANNKAVLYNLTSTYGTDSVGGVYASKYNWGPAIKEKEISLSTSSESEELVTSGLSQGTIALDSLNDMASDYKDYGFLYLAELYRPTINSDSLFGGKTASALQGNTWNVAGDAVPLVEGQSCTVPFDQGDTYYQRYDCLKTYPYSNDDKNQIVEILSFMCETRINIDGRYDANRGLMSNIDMRPQNFNLLNPVYTQNNNFFPYSYLDYRRFKEQLFPNSLLWTKTKTYGEDIDSWTNIQQSSVLDLDGDKGSLNALRNYNDNLMAFQGNGIARILYNERVQVNASDGVPIEIANSGKVQGKQYISDHIGCSNKRAIQSTSSGIYFMDGNSKDIYLLSEGIASLSKAKGFNSWLYGRDFSKFRAFFDEKASDIYFVDDSSCLVYNEQLKEFTGFYSYGGTDFMFNLEDHFAAVKDNALWHQFAGDYNYFFGSEAANYHPFSVTVISNQGLGDKIFGNVDFLADSWDGDTIQDSTFDTLSAWNEYQLGTSSISTSNSDKKYLFSNLKRKFRIWRADIPRAMYLSPATSIEGITKAVNAIEADGGSVDGISSDYTVKKSMDRIRSTWAYVKLSKLSMNKCKTVLHNLAVDYYD